MSRAFHEPVPVRAGRQTRSLVLDPPAVRRAEKALGGVALDVALRQGTMNAVCIGAAVALHHEDRKTTDKTVEAWIIEDASGYPLIVEAVSEAMRRFLVKTGQLEEIAEPGEEPAPQTP